MSCDPRRKRAYLAQRRHQVSLDDQAPRANHPERFHDLGRHPSVWLAHAVQHQSKESAPAVGNEPGTSRSSLPPPRARFPGRDGHETTADREPVPFPPMDQQRAEQRCASIALSRAIHRAVSPSSRTQTLGERHSVIVCRTTRPPISQQVQSAPPISQQVLTARYSGACEPSLARRLFEQVRRRAMI